MYAVIFRATINKLDQDYTDTAARLRELAKRKYGCLDFISTLEGQEEIAISYWQTMEQIARWKNDPEHKRAQELGKSKWYNCYQVQIVEIVRQYHNTT